ncbi:hypothetical protein A2U01_0090866, partial [Trifolium medium]|nr:hypothetical protein [Trifolium medium]
MPNLLKPGSVSPKRSGKTLERILLSSADFIAAQDTTPKIASS